MSLVFFKTNSASRVESLKMDQLIYNYHFYLKADVGHPLLK